MKFNITTEETRRILEMHLKEKKRGVINEQYSSPIMKQVQNLLKDICFKGTNSEAFIFDNPPKPEHDVLIKQTGELGGVQYLAVDGTVYKESPVGSGILVVSPGEKWSLDKCHRSKGASKSNALRDYYTKYLAAKTLEQWAAEGVNVLDFPGSYRSLDYLGEPLLYVSKALQIRSNFNPDGNSGRLLKFLKDERGAKLDYELNQLEKQDMQNPLRIKPDADFPNGLIYYLPHPSGERNLENDPTDYKYKGSQGSGASPDSTEGGPSPESANEGSTGSLATSGTYLEMYNNIRSKRRLDDAQLNECAEILRNWYDDWSRKVSYNQLDHQYFKSVAQACVSQLNPSKLSSIFGSKGGAIDRDTRKIINIMVGEGNPRVSETDPYRLRKNRAR